MSNFRPSALNTDSVNIDDKLGLKNLIASNGTTKSTQLNTSSIRKPEVTFDHWSAKKGSRLFAQSGNVIKSNTNGAANRTDPQPTNGWVKDAITNGKVSALRAMYQDGCNGSLNNNHLTKAPTKACSNEPIKAGLQQHNNNNDDVELRPSAIKPRTLTKLDESEKADMKIGDDLCRGAWSNGACLTSDLLF